MSKLGIRDVTLGDLVEIAKLDLLDDDLEEIKGTGNTDIQKVLIDSCLFSMDHVCRCFYIKATEEIVGIYGISKDNVIWFLSSKRLMEVWKEFVRGTKEEFKVLTKDHEYAYNYIHTNHKRAKRWLRWLGIHISEETYVFPPKTDLYHKLEFIKE